MALEHDVYAALTAMPGLKVVSNAPNPAVQQDEAYILVECKSRAARFARWLFHPFAKCFMNGLADRLLDKASLCEYEVGPYFITYASPATNQKVTVIDRTLFEIVLGG